LAGVDDFLTFPPPGALGIQTGDTTPLPSDQITIEFYVRRDGLVNASGFEHPIALGGGHNATIYVRSSGQVAFKFQKLGGKRVEASFGQLTLGQWHHTAVTYNGGGENGLVNWFVTDGTEWNAVGNPAPYTGDGSLLSGTPVTSETALLEQEVRLFDGLSQFREVLLSAYVRTFDADASKP